MTYSNGWINAIKRGKRNPNGGLCIKVRIGAAAPRKHGARHIYSSSIIEWLMNTGRAIQYNYRDARFGKDRYWEYTWKHDGYSYRI